jgi:hypothetical protein
MPACARLDDGLLRLDGHHFQRLVGHGAAALRAALAVVKDSLGVLVACASMQAARKAGRVSQQGVSNPAGTQPWHRARRAAAAIRRPGRRRGERNSPATAGARTEAVAARRDG